MPTNMTVNLGLMENGSIPLEFRENLKIPPVYNAEGDIVALGFKGFLKQKGAEYKLSGRLDIKAILGCDCCLKPVEELIIIEIDEIFSRTEEDSEEIYTMDSDSEIDLTGCIAANVFMAMPMKVVCHEDCKGLCPMCGANLNDGACGCEKPIDPRFETLRSLLKSEEV